MYFEKLRKHLFPLAEVTTSYAGYFMSTEGEVYSTMQSADGRKMTGSGTYGSKNRYYTLNGISVNGIDLFNRARRNTKWAEHTNPSLAKMVPEVAPKLQGTPADRSHARSLDEGLKAKGWVLAKVAEHKGEKFLMFGSKPAIHTTPASYRSELQRLATSQPGTKFVALRVETSLVAGGLVWE